MSQPLKVHIALNTPAFAESVAFYQAFFGQAPVKHKPGYAKFDVQDPPLNLTLNEVPAAAPGALNHLGIQVASTTAVHEAAGRLRAAGLATLAEKDTDCCYALQDKIWVTDPNGYRWEIFVVKVADTQPELQAGPAPQRSCCAPGATS
jgi:catechol 2,3-dioxygenase-like lactoylglutathione lyase family enzyme